MNFPIRGDVVGVEFYPEDVTDGRIVIRIAIEEWEPVGRCRVVLLDAEKYERSLPTADDVMGILARTDDTEQSAPTQHSGGPT
jgi:hypothetical protein